MAPFSPLAIDVALAALALIVFVADLLMPPAEKRGLGHITCVGLALILGASFVADVQGTAFGGVFVADALSLWFKRVFLAAGALAILVAIDPVERAFARRQGEFYLLLVCSLLGMSLLASARELVLFVVSFELMSLPLYALAAFAKTEARSSEAALKLYLVGATSLAITLFGLSLVYGATGTTHLDEIARAARASDAAFGGSSPLLFIGACITLAGLGFKIGAVPFHMWVPDTYEGAPTSFVTFLSVAPKVAGFAAIVRLFLEGFAPLGDRYAPVLAGICGLTLLVGNLLALPQDNVKRLLAYSGIAQIGYMLLGVVSRSNEGAAMLLFYLATYAFANIGAFGVVQAVGSSRGSDDISAYRGLARTQPALGFAMLLFLLSLGGIPFLVGFWAKLGVFIAAWHEGHVVLVALGALLAVVAVFYYMRLARSIYFDDPAPGAPRVEISNPLRIALIVSASAVVLFGLYPRPLFDGALAATRTLWP